MYVSLHGTTITQILLDEKIFLSSELDSVPLYKIWFAYDAW